MPPSEMTATSVVPPPMSTMSEPDGSLTGRPAPIAAAIGSSMRPRPAGAGVERGVADGPLLDLGDARRDAQQHPRPGDHADPVVDLVDEVLDHLLGHVEVADDAVAQRPDRDDVGRRPADHPLGLGADRQHALGLGVDRDDGRLAHDDAAVADVDERVGRPEVDPDVAGEEAEDAVEHLAGGSFVRWRSLARGRWAGRRGAGIAGVGRVARIHGRVGRAAGAVYPVALPGRRSVEPAASDVGPVERHAPVAQARRTRRGR